MFSQEVLNFIEICQWDTTKFLIISKNVFGPLIYYSHLLPLVASLLLVGFIFLKNRKDASIRWLTITVVLLCLWLFSDLILWATEKPEYTMFFWSFLVLIEPMIYVGMLFFAYALIGNRDVSFWGKVLIFTLLLPTILLVPTNFAITHYDLSNCDREAIEGPLASYGYIIEIIISIWIISFGVREIIKNKVFEDKRKIVLIIFGITFFLLSFAVGNVIGSLLVDWVIGQYGLFGIPVFLALLAYVIVRYKAFNLKVIGTQILVAALWIALLSILFIRTIENVRIIVSLTLILFLIIGFLLVKSVRKEVEQKEEIAGMAEDVKRAYIIEKKAKEGLEELDKVKNNFLSQVQHDLRTPLTSIMGYSDLLISGNLGKQPKKTIEVVKKIQVVAQNMKKKADSFLDVAQFRLGKGFLSLKPRVEVGPILKEIIDELQFKAEEGGIYLKFDSLSQDGRTEDGAEASGPKNEFFISADREKLKTALFNVVDNAIKYTKNGGVTIKLEIRNSKLEIIVSDTGIGIPADKLTSLFNTQFERTEQAQKTAEGKGIGLYLSAQIIKYHNGRIWAESDGEGKGSAFYVELPIGNA